MDTNQPPTNRRRGRPKSAPGTKCDVQIGIHVTRSERDEVHAHCEKLGLVPARWLRSVLLDLIRRGDSK